MPPSILALVPGIEFVFLPPILLAIALVTAAAHRENMRSILFHALRAWIVLLVGLTVFALTLTTTFELLLPR